MGRVIGSCGGGGSWSGGGIVECIESSESFLVLWHVAAFLWHGTALVGVVRIDTGIDD